jgi:adenylate kinase
MFNLILFGPPGSGKGTQAAKIIEKYKLKHLSTGDLLRAEKKSGSKLGKKIADLINNGNLVPDEMVQEMVKTFVFNNKECNGFIFDGFPRTVTQAEWLKEMLNPINAEVNILLHLHVDDNILIERILERGKSSGRDDDKDVSIINNRIEVYHKITQPVMDFYKSQGKYRKVDGIGSIDKVFGRICNVIDSESL